MNVMAKLEILARAMLLAFAVGSNLAFTTTGATVDTTGPSVNARDSAADTLKWEDLAPPWDEAE
ncbi:MAG: hypothetical protein R3D01_09820, partial [Hyphomicrobiales bacterium]